MGGSDTHASDSCCCTAETSRTLLSNYTPIKNKSNLKKERKVCENIDCNNISSGFIGRREKTNFTK